MCIMFMELSPNLNSAKSIGTAQPFNPQGSTMADPAHDAGLTPDELDEGIPFMQQLLDNPFIVLFLGVVTPTLLYVIWGVMAIVGIPVAK